MSTQSKMIRLVSFYLSDESIWKYFYTKRILDKGYFWVFILPDELFHNHNPWFGQFYVFQERRATDFHAPKFWKGSSGIRIIKGSPEWFECNINVIA